MISLTSLLSSVSLLTATPVELEEGLSMILLIIVGALALFLGFLFSRKTALMFIDWVKSEQSRDKFSGRFKGFFYDWGTSRLEAGDSMKKPASGLMLILVEVLLGIALFAVPFFIRKWVWLLLVAAILLGCALFTGMTLRSESDKESIPVAFILPLQVYAAIAIFVSMIAFIGIAIYEFFKSAIAHTSPDRRTSDR